jgi:hypothetical protein
MKGKPARPPMKKHFKARKRQAGQSPSEIAALVDEGARLHSRIRKNEECLREYRTKLKQAGRLDLVQKFLVAPTELRDLAGFLWRNEAIVTFHEKHGLDANKVASTDFPKQFALRAGTRRVGDGLTFAQLDELIAAARAKVLSNFSQRTKGQIDRTSAVRELAIQFAWMWPLEEWACIFRDAALAGDTDFIEKILALHGTGPQSLDHIDAVTVVNWNGTHENTVPPLKYWSDQAACEFVCFVTSEDLKLPAYKKRKQRLGLRSDKPVLVTFAECSQRNGKRLLSCSR